MMPVTTGVVPFGLVMGSVASEAKLSFVQTMGMNFIVLAGASQLVAVDLLVQNIEIAVIVVTGIVINLRMMLYSAALAPHVQGERFILKLMMAYGLTDQAFAVMAANQDSIESQKDKTIFYLSGAICMILIWHVSVILGFTFGNFLPESVALEFAIPLSFTALVIPTLKNLKYVTVALFAAVSSIALINVPYNLGLLCASLSAIILAFLLTYNRRHE